MKYIDAEKLIAEIERLRDIAQGYLCGSERQSDLSPSQYRMEGIDTICSNLLSFITSLQQEQPKVDLEKELDRYLRGEFQQTAGGNFNNYIQVARHFAKWGAIHLNARKEE